MDNELLTGLTYRQMVVLGLCKNYGAEIQVDFENDQYVYTLVEEDGNVETVRRDTFKKLATRGLISLKYRPSINSERWG